MPWYGSNELYDVCQVVLVPGVVVAGVALEQVVTGGHLEGHARGRPDVGGGTVPSPEEDLQTPVLPGLDVVSEMVVLGHITLQLAHLTKIFQSIRANALGNNLPPSKRCPGLQS